MHQSRSKARRPQDDSNRKPYSKPRLESFSDRDLLEILGPAQGYGSLTDPIDDLVDDLPL